MSKKGIFSIAVVLIGGAISALGSELIGEYVFSDAKEKVTGKLEDLTKKKEDDE